MLGKTQSSNNEDWIRTLANIELIVSREEVEKLAEQTVREIKKVAGIRKAGFAWSGGKDSMVLQQLCYRAGIRDCVLVLTRLEYPAFEQRVTRHKPENLSILNTGQDPRWLQNNPHMLFPRDAKTAARWFQIVQHRGQDIYFHRLGLDILLLGRRRKDGNYVGAGKETMYKTRHGVVRYSPMADWPHEYILAFMRYYQLPFAPFYSWKNGFICSTHPWPARQYTTTGWRDVYEIDKTIVVNAARYLDSAKEFLRTGGA